MVSYGLIPCFPFVCFSLEVFSVWGSFWGIDWLTRLVLSCRLVLLTGRWLTLNNLKSSNDLVLLFTIDIDVKWINWISYSMYVNSLQVTYSKRLKSERSDFSAFQSCPIPKRFGFQTFGFQTFGLPTGTKPNVLFLNPPLS